MSSLDDFTLDTTEMASDVVNVVFLCGVIEDFLPECTGLLKVD